MIQIIKDKRTPAKSEAEKQKAVDDFFNSSVHDETSRAFRDPIPKESQQEKENYNCLINNAKRVSNQYKRKKMQTSVRNAPNGL